jgi:hypothetical protein
MCKLLLAQQKSGAIPCAYIPPAVESASIVPLECVAHCARLALAAIRAACDGGDGWDASRARACAALLETEAMPQAARWHRRDLVPALLAAWRAVLRSLARPNPAPTPWKRATTL